MLDISSMARETVPYCLITGVWNRQQNRKRHESIISCPGFKQESRQLGKTSIFSVVRLILGVILITPERWYMF